MSTSQPSGAYRNPHPPSVGIRKQGCPFAPNGLAILAFFGAPPGVGNVAHPPLSLLLLSRPVDGTEVDGTEVDDTRTQK